MADLLSKLQMFLLEQARTPFAYGGPDCGLLLADWVLYAKGGEDPAATVRGSYSDEGGARAILEWAGGFEAYVSALADASGCPPTDTPQDGDFGLLDMPKAGLTGGICTNGSWAFRTSKGMAWAKITPGRLVKAWSLNA